MDQRDKSVKTGIGGINGGTPTPTSQLEASSALTEGVLDHPDCLGPTIKLRVDWHSKRDLTEWAKDIADWRQRKGFETSWENMMVKLMLVVTEVSEAAEAYRKPDRQNFDEEIADTLIRLLDICGSIGIDIEKELSDKMAVNETRPTKHGKVC